MDPQDESQDIMETSAYNPFPEPQTIPSGWDLSELILAPETDSVADDEDCAKR